MKTTKRVFTGLTAGAVAISMLAGSFQLTRAEEARTKEVVQAEITKLEKELGLSEGYVLNAKLAEAKNDLTVKSIALKEAEGALKKAQEINESKVKENEAVKAAQTKVEDAKKAVNDANKDYAKLKEDFKDYTEETAEMKSKLTEVTDKIAKAEVDLKVAGESLDAQKELEMKKLTGSEDYKKLEQAVKEAQEAEAAAKKLVNDLSKLEALIRELRGGKPAPKPEEKKNPAQKVTPQKGGGAASKIKTGV